MSGRYASYWNAFLLNDPFQNFESYLLPIQAHDAILKQIQDDREQQKLRRQGKLSAATSSTVTASASNAAADDKPPPEKKIDDTALLQVVAHWELV